MICLTKERIIFDLLLSDFETLRTFLKIKDVKFKESQRLSDISHIKIGGRIPMLILPKSIDELTFVLSYLVKSNINYKLVGRMTNILPKDEDFVGVIVKTDDLEGYSISGNVLTAECGCTLPTLAYRAYLSGLSGLEEISGIPGSVGASVFGNAGAFGKEISDIFLSARIYSARLNKIYTVYPSDMKFGYRTSAYLGSDFALLTARFRLIYAEREQIKKKLENYKSERLAKQPHEHRTLGSVFRRPNGDFASRMIDEVGLKGYRVGGAVISSKHAGFIENIGGATAEDYKMLVEIARARVLSRFGVLLEPEIEIW